MLNRASTCWSWVVIATPCALGALPANAATFHVALSGDDATPGSRAKPFRTIQKAVDAARPGDKILVDSGRYCEAISLNTSGAPGAPIVIEGIRSPRGEYLTVVDPTVAVTGWEPATEVGPGVFKTTALKFVPHSMTLAGKQLARIRDQRMKSSDGFDLLRMPASATIRNNKVLASFPYMGPWVSKAPPEAGAWDGVEAYYAHRDGTTYIRFRNGDDPTGKALRAGGAGNAVTIHDQSHIVLRNLHVCGAQTAVRISGLRATHNTVEDCLLWSKRTRVALEDDAAFNTLRNNEMTMNYYGFGHPKPPTPGYVYRVFKYIIGGNMSDDTGVIVAVAGEGNEIVGNYLHDGLIGVDVGQSLRLRVHHNIIRRMHSIGICTGVNRGKGVIDGEFYENLLVDCSISLRIHSYSRSLPGERREYHYRNRFCQTGEWGIWHVFVHWPTEQMLPGTEHPDIFIYHNSIAGGPRAMQPNRTFPRGVMLNNVFSARWPWWMRQSWADRAGLFAAYDYNWCGGEYIHGGKKRGGRPLWLGPHNILAEGRQMWETKDAVPDFRLPADSDARQAGLDLSKPFTLSGRQFPALPGMKPGYFKGRAPDLGAVQYGEPPAVGEW